MTLSVYNETFELIAQFDNYKDLSNYLKVSIGYIRSYLSKPKKNVSKCIKNKTTDEFVFVIKDYFKEDL